MKKHVYEVISNGNDRRTCWSTGRPVNKIITWHGAVTYYNTLGERGGEGGKNAHLQATNIVVSRRPWEIRHADDAYHTHTYITSIAFQKRYPFFTKTARTHLLTSIDILRNIIIIIILLSTTIPWPRAHIIIIVIVYLSTYAQYDTGDNNTHAPRTTCSRV